MTAICPGGGASSARPGFGLSVSMGSAALAARFANSPSWISVFIAAFIAGVDFTLLTFCSTDPPADVSFVAQDFGDLLVGPVGGASYFAANAKLTQWVLHRLWWDFCQCAAGNPPVPTDPAAPANLPTINPPGLNAPTVVAPTCFTATTGPQAILGGSWTLLTYKWATFSSRVFPAVTQVWWLRLRGGRTATGAGPHDVSTYVLRFLDDQGSQVGPDTNFSSPQLVDLLVPVPQIATAFATSPFAAQMTLFQNSPAGSTDTYDFTTDLYCSPMTPTGLAGTPCCPPDPAIAAQLNQVLQLVTLLQRNRLPYAYIKGAVHTGATLTGSVSVQGLLGIEVQLTAIPVQDPVLAGNPPYIKDLGWCSISETDGMIQERRVAQANFVWLPHDMQLADHFNYALQAGVSMTWTELLPEP